MFALSLPNGLNKKMHLNITDKALLNKSLVLNLKSDINALSSSISTYEGEKVESMLGYVNKDFFIHIA